MNYLDLVNFAIEESGLELDLLDEETWDSYVAGRRVYPRLKRYVQQSWKNIQLQRNQWEFGSAKVSQLVFPRFVVSDVAGWPMLPGDVFVGDDSGFVLSILRVIENDLDSTVTIEFTSTGEYKVPRFGELFIREDAQAEFVFVGRGSYDFGLDVPALSEIQWNTFTITAENAAPMQATYIPYSTWMYEVYDFASGSRTAPAFLSQDYKGEVVFLHQTYQPFTVSFIYSVQPQILIDWDDVPRGFPEAYHEWIAWEAVKRIATYDKNPQLYAHAERNAQFYRNRAEVNLMPHVSWRGNAFNV